MADPMRPNASGANSDEAASNLPAAAAQNVALIAELERAALRERTRQDKIADAISAIAGSLAFVAAHIAVFVLWALVNGGAIAAIRPFDPYPFVFLTMIVSMEGVLIAAFVLIKQNRMSKRTDERAHLDFQVGLLTERELSKAIQILNRVAEKVGAADAVDAQAREMATETSLDLLAEDVRQLVAERPDGETEP